MSLLGGTLTCTFSLTTSRSVWVFELEKTKAQHRKLLKHDRTQFENSPFTVVDSKELTKEDVPRLVEV